MILNIAVNFLTQPIQTICCPQLVRLCITKIIDHTIYYIGETVLNSRNIVPAVEFQAEP